MKGYERKKGVIIYRFTKTGSGPESLANLLSDLDKKWYKARYSVRVYRGRQGVTVFITRRGK